MAGPIVENNLDEFYRECLKVHVTKISDSETEAEKSDFDETYFKLKPPPVPYSRIKNHIVKLRRAVNTQVQKEDGGRKTYAFVVKSFPSKLAQNKNVVFENNRKQPQLDITSQNNDKQAKKKKKRKRKRKKKKPKNSECNLNDEVTLPKPTTNDEDKRPKLISNPMEYRREINVQKDVQFLQMLKHQGGQIYQQQISISEPCPINDWASKNKYTQRQEIKLLENNRILKNPDSQIYQQQTTTSKPTTNDDYKRPELVKGPGEYQKDVQFLQNGGMSTDQGRQAHQQQTNTSKPNVICDAQLLEKDRTLKNECEQVYQRERYMQLRDVKLLENDRQSKNEVNQIYKQQTRTPEVNVKTESDSLLKNENPVIEQYELDVDEEDEFMDRYRRYKTYYREPEEHNFGALFLWSTLIIGGLYLLKLTFRD